MFVDRNVSPDDNTFWFISPGIEELGSWVDFRANGYFPTNTKKQYGSTDWADNFGVYDYVSFQGHNQYDILMTQDEEVGWGADAEVGGKIPGLKGTRAYLGGYHFNFSDASDINGVAARIEMPINRYLGITVRDSYDNEQHNMFLLGLKLTIGGVNIHPRDPHQAIQERILDPIERNLATLGQGVGEPVQEVLTPVPSANPVNPNPPPLVERDNIWFFSSSGTSTFTGSINDCTLGNVCIDSNFNQDTINGINALKLSSPDINNYHSSSPTFYLANPGTYSALNNGIPLQLNNDWLWGRTADFKQEQQTNLTGALTINGLENQLFYIVLQNSVVSPQTTGITLNQGSRLDIIHSIIGENPELMNAAVIEETNYATAIQLQDASLKISDDSKIYAYAFDGQLVTGIQANYSSGAQGYELKVENSEVLAKTFLSDNMQNNNTVTALSLQNAPAVTLTNAQITALASAPGDLDSNNINMATGINANNSQVTMTATDLFATAEVNNDNNGVNMAVAIGANNSSTDLRFQDNTFTITGGSINANARIRNNNISSAINMAAGVGENALGIDMPTARATVPIFRDNTFTFDNTRIESTASVEGNGDNSFNQATGIGGNANRPQADASLIHNNLTLENNSQINVNALVNDDNAGINFATGIGGNAANAKANFGGTTEGERNTINLLTGSSITSTANIMGNNDSINFSSAIGGNALAFTPGTEANFNINTIKLDGTADSKIELNSNSTINTSNRGGNLATGIGGNILSTGNSNFNENNISLNNTEVNSNATVTLDNTISSNALNFSAGLGGNSIDGNTDFSDNIINVSNSSIKANARINRTNQTLNSAAALGSNSRSFNFDSSATFAGNTINIISGSTLEASAIVATNSSGGSANAYNLSTGLGSNAPLFNNSAFVNFTNNTIAIVDSTLSATANVTVISARGFNTATGLGTGAFNGPNQNFTSTQPLNITNSTVKAQTLVANNAALNIASGILFNNSITDPMTVNIAGKEVTAEAISTTGNPSNGTSAIGVGVTGQTAMTLTISTTDNPTTITAKSSNNNNNNAAAGIYAFLNTPTSSTFNMNTGTITVQASGGGTANKCQGNATFNISPSIATCVP